MIPCSLDGGVGLPQLALSVNAVSLASPLSVFTEVDARDPSAGKALQLWARLLCEDAEPLLLGGTWVVRGTMVGSILSSPLVLSLEDLFWGRDTSSLGVVGDDVVSGEVAAAVAVVATSEKAGASSWGTSWVTGSLASEADTEPGIVEYPATEPSLLKKCWSPSKFLVSRCSWSSRLLKTGWWFGMFTGDTVVTAWSSLSKSGVTGSLFVLCALLPKLLLSSGPKNEKHWKVRQNITGWEVKKVCSRQEQHVFLTKQLFCPILMCNN